MSEDNIEKAFKQFERMEKEIKKDQQEAEELEEDAEQHEKEAEKEAEEAAAEEQEAEERGDQSELIDAEQEEQHAEEELETAEEDIDRVEHDIEEQIELEEEQEELINKIEKQAEKEMKDAFQSLNREINRLKAVQNSDQKNISRKDYKKIEDVLDELSEAIGAFTTSARMAERVVKEIQRTEKEEIRAEDLTAHIPQEMDLMQDIVSGFLSDFRKLQDSQHEEMAQKEASELNQEKSQFQSEVSIENQIDRELSSDANLLSEVVEEDRKIFQLVEKTIGELDELEDILEEERSMWEFANLKPPIKDVRQRKRWLKKQLKSNQSRLEQVSSGISTITAKMPSGPSMPSKRGFAKYGTAAVAVFAGVVILLFL